jgi:hypothetical protein
MMLHTWFYVEDELLLAIYKTVVKHGGEKTFIEFVFKEIERRNLHPKNYLTLIK